VLPGVPAVDSAVDCSLPSDPSREVRVTAVDPRVSVRTQVGGRVPARDVVGAYVNLTKPRIIELLLVTTVPVMFLAQRGVPSLELVVATVVGGTLSAGSANVL